MKDIKVVIDGEVFKPVDAKGFKVEASEAGVNLRNGHSFLALERAESTESIDEEIIRVEVERLKIGKKPEDAIRNALLIKECHMKDEAYRKAKKDLQENL